MAAWSRTKLRTRPETVTSARRLPRQAGRVTGLEPDTGVAEACRAAATNPSDVSTPSMAAGSQVVQDGRRRAPVPQPTSAQVRPARARATQQLGRHLAAPSADVLLVGVAGSPGLSRRGSHRFPWTPANPCGTRSATFPRKRAGHSITCAARTRSDCGSVSPRARAVLRLIMSSSVAGCSIGRSAGLRAFQDAVNVARRAAEVVGHGRPVRHQAACLAELQLRVHRGQPVPGRHRHDALALTPEVGVGEGQHRVHASPACAAERPLDVLDVAGLDALELDAEGPGRGLEARQLVRVRVVARVPTTATRASDGSACAAARAACRPARAPWRSGNRSRCRRAAPGSPPHPAAPDRSRRRQ